MAKKKNNKHNKNKKNNSPAVAPKAKFSASAKKNDKSKIQDKKKVEKQNKPCAFCEKIKENKKLVAIISAAVVLVIALAVTLTVLLCNRVPELAISEYNGQDATVSFVSDITVDEETQLERYDEIKRKIKGNKNKFKFYCRPSIEIDDKYNEGTIMFSNLTVNDCTMIVTIMDEEDSIIFRSMGIAPGKCMQRVNLSKSLTFGEHTVTMYVTAYDRKTYEVIGTQSMKLDLLYGDEYSASEDAELSTTETTANPSVTRPVEATSATAIVPTTTTTTMNTTVKPTQKTVTTTKAS